MNVGMIETLALGVLALVIGGWLNRKVPVLRSICIPSPITGGLVVSMVTLFLHSYGNIDISFEMTLKDVCMLMFFTSVGFQCDFRLLRTGGRPLLVLTVLVAVLITLQNLLSIGLSGILGQDPLLGMTAGSITMSGGHGTAGGFAPILESKGLQGATTISMAAATFGIIAGSIMGGPLGKSLVDKFSLKPEATPDSQSPREHTDSDMHQGSLMTAVCVLCVSAGIGSLLSRMFSVAGLTVPTYFGSMIVAITVRNILEKFTNVPKLPVQEIVSVGRICLYLFLGMALVTLRLWELADIALPLMVILLSQTLLMYLFARFIAFRMMGGNYDAAVLTGGLCGFGLGATPNAMANMNAICLKYGYSPLPFIIVPMVGAAFVDVINISIITFFLNII